MGSFSFKDERTRRTELADDVVGRSVRIGDPDISIGGPSTVVHGHPAAVVKASGKVRKPAGIGSPLGLNSSTTLGLVSREVT